MLKNCKTFFENKHFYSALSVVAITSATGAKEQEMSYDAWGRRRNPANWSYDGLPDSTTYLINRGYTFHQHYDKLGLINMNGRVYDPIVGRFLSVDPLVGNPLSAQDYNGYSYCANNPMKYTDPSGYTYWQYKDGEWSHFEYHPFQNGSANFREAASGGSNLRYGYEGPGQGRNGTGLSGYYYDWFSGSYRTTAGSRTPWSEVYYNAVVPNAFTLDFSVQLSKKIKPNPKLYNKPGNHDAEIKALIAKYYTAYKKQILGYHSDDTAPPGFEYNKENGTYTYIGPTTDYLNNGASVLGAQLDGVIYVSPYACDNTLNLTFSHELGHILLNDAGLTDVNKQECALYFSMYKLTYNQEYWLLYYHYGHRFPPRYGTIIDGIIRK